MRHLVFLPDNLVNTRQRTQQCDERLLAAKDHASNPRLHQRSVSRELNRVPQTLFGIEQDGGFRRRGSVPARLLKGNRRRAGKLPAPFILAPPASEVSFEQPGETPVVTGGCKIRSEVQCLLVGRQCLVDPLGVKQDDSETVVELGAARRQLEGAPAGGD